MPLYEYKCDRCGQFDVWRSLADYQKPLDCETCDRPAKRLFSPPTILSSGLSNVRRVAAGEPKLVKSGDREPPKPRNTVKSGGRPWMFNH
ncbi:MAG: zinc ribbon domain-containing protein [Cyanobacteria bacterium J06639_1]